MADDDPKAAFEAQLRAMFGPLVDPCEAVTISQLFTVVMMHLFDLTAAQREFLAPVVERLSYALSEHEYAPYSAAQEVSLFLQEKPRGRRGLTPLLVQQRKQNAWFLAQRPDVPLDSAFVQSMELPGGFFPFGLDEFSVWLEVYWFSRASIDEILRALRAAVESITLVPNVGLTIERDEEPRYVLGEVIPDAESLSLFVGSELVGNVMLETERSAATCAVHASLSIRRLVHLSTRRERADEILLVQDPMAELVDRAADARAKQLARQLTEAAHKREIYMASDLRVGKTKRNR